MGPQHSQPVKSRQGSWGRVLPCKWRLFGRRKPLTSWQPWLEVREKGIPSWPYSAELKPPSCWPGQEGMGRVHYGSSAIDCPYWDLLTFLNKCGFLFANLMYDLRIVSNTLNVWVFLIFFFTSYGFSAKNGSMELLMLPFQVIISTKYFLSTDVTSKLTLLYK